MNAGVFPVPYHSVAVSEETSIQVNFGRPIPIFPLDAVTLLPQQVLPLHVFEPRYRQMVDQALDGAGQIAMAVFEGEEWKDDYHGRPALRPAVCVGQIVQHEKLFDGRYNLLLQGVCRARIIEEMAPDGERLYRVAMLEPVGLDASNTVIQTPIDDDDDEGGDEAEAVYPPPEAAFAADAEDDDDEDETLDAPDPEHLRLVRERIGSLLSEGPLTQMTAAEPILEYVNNDDIPVSALLELVSFTLISEPDLRYALLAEPHVERRAEIILGELDHLASLIRRAEAQRPQDWPKGLSWN